MRSRKPLMLLPAAVRIQMVAARLALNNTATTETYPLSLHVALPICCTTKPVLAPVVAAGHLSCRGIRAIYRAEVSHE